MGQYKSSLVTPRVWMTLKYWSARTITPHLPSERVRKTPNDSKSDSKYSELCCTAANNHEQSYLESGLASLFRPLSISTNYWHCNSPYVNFHHLISPVPNTSATLQDRSTGQLGYVRDYYSPGWHKDYPRLQILTTAELLRGAEVKMPPQFGTFKEAQKVKQGATGAEQSEMFG